jgi:hypothetical protein
MQIPILELHLQLSLKVLLEECTANLRYIQTHIKEKIIPRKHQKQILHVFIQIKNGIKYQIQTILKI